jgi:hypothetical protein
MANVFYVFVSSSCAFLLLRQKLSLNAPEAGNYVLTYTLRAQSERMRVSDEASRQALGPALQVY